MVKGQRQVCHLFKNKAFFIRPHVSPTLHLMPASASSRLAQQAAQFPPSADTMTQRPNVVLYTDHTPNGIKISIALEELGIVR